MPIYRFKQDPNYREVISFVGIRLVLEYRQWHSSPWSAYREFADPEVRALAKTKQEVIGQWVLNNITIVQSKITYRKIHPVSDDLDRSQDDIPVDLLFGEPEDQAGISDLDVVATEEGEQGLAGHGCPHAQAWLVFPAGLCSTCEYGKQGWLCCCGTINDMLEDRCTYCGTGKGYQWDIQDILKIPEKIQQAQQEGRFKR